MQTVNMILGPPASGKSTLTKYLVEKEGMVSLNRDKEGGKIVDLLPKMEALLKDNKSVVLDNLFPTIEVRKPFIELAKRYNVPIHATVKKTTIEDCTFNFVQRAIGILGTFPEPELVKKSKHPNIFPPTVLFKYKKDFQKPTVEEGFDTVSESSFGRQDDPAFTNKALIVDYDGTLRECINGNDKYPVIPEQIQMKPGRREVLQSYKDKGYLLLGISNQSGVAKGELTLEKAKELFDYTNQQLGLDIEYRFCPHQSAPISCYCRKPQVGIGVEFILKHKLNRKECYFVGDMTTDKTFATRCGFQYVDQAEFFK
jgi:D-glycero-D-manno-heptose 1,7-bisphosphate phosphatase